MKKILFLDRDGTIIVEPPVHFQVDTLEKLELMPGVIRNLYKIVSTMSYDLVMISNQDGLGSPAYPVQAFETVQNKLLKLLSNEGIRFSAIHIDTSFAHENSPNRKPGTGMVRKYLNGKYDLKNSFVIGDGLSDIGLAKNMGVQGILIRNSNNRKMKLPADLKPMIALDAKNWDEIYRFLCSENSSTVVD